MIDRVEGIVSRVEPMQVVVNLGAVSLRASVPLSTSSRMSAGSTAVLWMELIVREDSLALFGFATEKERSYFNLLRTVAGVGPKLACTVLSGVSVDALEQAITRGEPGLLSRIPGIGRKTAGRIVMELSGKIDGVLQPAGMAALPSTEAVEALMSLGYQRAAAARAVETALAELGSDAQVEEVVRVALRSSAAAPRKGKA